MSSTDPTTPASPAPLSSSNRGASKGPLDRFFFKGKTAPPPAEKKSIAKPTIKPTLAAKQPGT